MPTPEEFKQRILAKYPNGVASDGTPYAQMDATDLTRRMVEKYPQGVTNDGVKYADFLTPQSPAPAPTASKSASGFAKNLVTSTGSAVAATAKGVANLVNPKPAENTMFSIANLGVGLLQKAIKAATGRQDIPDTKEMQMADAVINHYKDRYGGTSNLLDTLYKDPAGVALDISSVLDPLAGGAAKVAGEGSKIASVANAARDIVNAASPVNVALQGVGKAAEIATAGRRIAPFAKSVDQAATMAATARGVELPASAVSTSRVVPLVESAVGKGFFGTKLTDRTDTALQRLNDIADATVAAADTGATVANPVRAGSLIQKGVQKFRDAYLEEKAKLFSEARLPAPTPPGMAPVDAGTGNALLTVKSTPDAAVEYLKSVVFDKQMAAKVLGGARDLPFFETMLKNLSKGADARTIQNTLRELDKRVRNFNDPIATGNQAIFRTIGAKLSDHLDTLLKKARPDLAANLDAANAFYQSGLDRLKSAYGKQMVRLKDQPDKLAAQLITPSTSVEDIPKIYDMIGPEATDAVRSVLLDKMFRDARGMNGNFTQAGLFQQIRKFGDEKLMAALKPEQYTAVKDLDTLARSLGKAEKVASGSQTAFITRTITELMAAGINPLFAFKAILSDVALSKLVSSNFGQKLLTTGVTLSGKSGRAIQSAAPAIGSASKIPYQAQQIKNAMQPQRSE